MVDFMEQDGSNESQGFQGSAGYDDFLRGEKERNFYSELKDSGFGSEQEILEHMAGDMGISLEELVEQLNDEDGGQLPRKMPKPGQKPIPGKQPQPDTQKFQPLKFQGEYDSTGPVDLEINSREQLDSYIEKGLLADKVYEQYENLQQEYEGIKEDAELGRTLQQKLDENPSQFLEETLRDIFFSVSPQETLKFLSKMYHQFDSIQKNPDKYRANHLEWDMKYNKPKENNSKYEEELSKLNEERNKFTLDVETKKLESWKVGMMSKYGEISDYISKVSGDSKWFDKYMNLVMEKGMNKVRSGRHFGPKELEAELKELIAPIHASYRKMQRPGATGNKSNTRFKPPMQQDQGRTPANNGKKMKDILEKYKMSFYNN